MSVMYLTRMALVFTRPSKKERQRENLSSYSLRKTVLFWKEISADLEKIIFDVDHMGYL